MSDTSPNVPDWLGRLTRTEQRVWHAFGHGQLVDLRSGAAESDDPAHADHWPAGRRVRAAVIAALLLGAQAQPQGRIAALRLAGARITGALDIAHGQVSAPCLLRHCQFDGPVNLDAVSADALDLLGSRFCVITAHGAHIGGRLNLTDTVITGRDGDGLRADGIVIDGALIARRMAVTGAVFLINGAVGGQLVLDDARLCNPGGVALNLGGLHVGRSLYAAGTVTDGAMRMPGTRVSSSFVLDGARLLNAEDVALFAESLTVASDLHAHGMRADGQVTFTGARIGAGVHLGGAVLQASKEPAIRADHMTVDGSLYLDDGFTTAGEIRLTGSRIGGHLDLNGITSPDALLTLFAVQVDTVRDGATPWPARLNLEGFTYRDLSPYRPATQRIQLLKSQVKHVTHEPGGYRAQPFEQLAAYYRSLGHDEEARTVRLAKERTRRRTAPWAQRIPGWLLDVAVGYGYRPLRAVAWALGLLAFATAFFARYRPVRVQSGDTAAYNPFLYAIDQLVPLVHVGQQDAFQSRGIAAVVATGLNVVGWALSVAIAAAATRTLSSQS